jgi:hypothetical protein
LTRPSTMAEVAVNLARAQREADAIRLKVNLLKRVKDLLDQELAVEDWSLQLRDFVDDIDTQVLDEMIFTTQIVRLDGKHIPSVLPLPSDRPLTAENE